MDATVCSSRSALAQRPPRRRRRRLITPLSAPMSRHRCPTGSSSNAVILRYFACLSTDFRNSANASSALMTSLRAGSWPSAPSVSRVVLPHPGLHRRVEGFQLAARGLGGVLALHVGLGAGGEAAP